MRDMARTVEKDVHWAKLVGQGLDGLAIEDVQPAGFNAFGRGKS